jgi:hypothetical protein
MLSKSSSSSMVMVSLVTGASLELEVPAIVDRETAAAGSGNEAVVLEPELEDGSERALALALVYASALALPLPLPLSCRATFSARSISCSRASSSTMLSSPKSVLGSSRRSSSLTSNESLSAAGATAAEVRRGDKNRSLASVVCFEVDATGCVELVKKGDVVYVPRGA